MRRFVLYHPSSGTYVSSVSYDRSNRRMNTLGVTQNC